MERPLTFPRPALPNYFGCVACDCQIFQAWDGIALFPAMCSREAFRATGQGMFSLFLPENRLLAGYFGCPDHPKVPYGCDFWPLGKGFARVISAAGEVSAASRGSNSPCSFSQQVQLTKTLGCIVVLDVKLHRQQYSTVVFSAHPPACSGCSSFICSPA